MREKVPFPSAYTNFRDWCEENGETDAMREYTSQRFHAEMDQHYPRSDTKTKGVSSRIGIHLVAGPGPPSKSTGVSSF